jgi:hypothetical protein
MAILVVILRLLTGTPFCAGDMVAYMLSESGSDWKTIKLLSVAADGSTTDLPDVCKLVRFSCLTWTLDGRGFFYCKCNPLSAACL